MIAGVHGTSCCPLSPTNACRGELNAPRAQPRPRVSPSEPHSRDAWECTRNSWPRTSIAASGNNVSKSPPSILTGAPSSLLGRNGSREPIRCNTSPALMRFLGSRFRYNDTACHGPRCDLMRSAIAITARKSEGTMEKWD